MKIAAHLTYISCALLALLYAKWTWLHQDSSVFHIRALGSIWVKVGKLLKYPQNSVRESKLILSEGRIVLEAWKTSVLMENLKTTEFQISLETCDFDFWEERSWEWNGTGVTGGGNKSSVPFHRTGGVNKEQNSPWKLLMQEGSSTRGVSWNVMESTNYLGDGERNFTGNMGRVPWFVLMKIQCSPHCE